MVPLQHLPTTTVFPFNWFPQRVGSLDNFVRLNNESIAGFHSIGFPSEWGAKLWIRILLLRRGFHSIGFPSEWGELVKLMDSM